MFKFLLPDPGEGLVEADIVAWHVAPGDEVRVNDILVEVETAKSLVELPSPVSGTVVGLLAEPGETVAVGSPIIEIDDHSRSAAEPRDDVPLTATAEAPLTAAADAQLTATADAATPNEQPSPPASAFEADEPPQNLIGSGPAPEPTARRRPATATEAVEFVQTAATTAAGTVLAKPLVRRLARDLGVRLGAVRPTGPEGTVSREDVLAAAGLGPAVAGERVPMQGVRKATARNMADSVARHVHVTEFNTVDVTATMSLVETLRGRREFRDLHVSPMLIHAKAVCLAMARQPVLNATLDADSGEVVYHDAVNLGIAAATPRGLLVPVIKGADKMNLIELCTAINELVATARDGKLQPADYSGGTFSITNVGVFGIDTGTPIINGDESAILAMGAIKRRPWVVGEGDDERIEPRWVTTLALSFDHQLIDGEQGSKFLADVSTILESPELAMLF